MNKPKTQIIFTKDSPIYIVNAERVLDHEGNSIEIKPVIGICKCGKSLKMPYCDESHGMDRLVEEEAIIPNKGKWRTYQGKEISINFNLAICSHVGLCLKNLPTVFNKDTKPWINPDGDCLEAIIDAIRKCPSGALTYSIGDKEYTNEDDSVRIKLVQDGPLAVRGAVDLIDDEASHATIHDHGRYTLCRCGKSKSKPFCDGSHRSDLDK